MGQWIYSMVLLTRASIAHDIPAKRQALEIQALANGTRAYHGLLMSRAISRHKTIGSFNADEIGPFLPALEWPFSPDPNTQKIIFLYRAAKQLLLTSKDGYCILSFDDDFEGPTTPR